MALESSPSLGLNSGLVDPKQSSDFSIVKRQSGISISDEIKSMQSFLFKQYNESQIVSELQDASSAISKFLTRTKDKGLKWIHQRVMNRISEGKGLNTTIDGEVGSSTGLYLLYHQLKLKGQGVTVAGEEIKLDAKYGPQMRTVSAKREEIIALTQAKPVQEKALPKVREIEFPEKKVDSKGYVMLASNQEQLDLPKVTELTEKVSELEGEVLELAKKVETLEAEKQQLLSQIEQMAAEKQRVAVSEQQTQAPKVEETTYAKMPTLTDTEIFPASTAMLDPKPQEQLVSAEKTLPPPVTAEELPESPALSKPVTFDGPVIVIDPSNPRGPSMGAEYFREGLSKEDQFARERNIAAAEQLKGALEERGYNVVLTEDRSTELYERLLSGWSSRGQTALSHRYQTSAFISLNIEPSETGSTHRAYYYGREGAQIGKNWDKDVDYSFHMNEEGIVAPEVSRNLASVINGSLGSVSSDEGIVETQTQLLRWLRFQDHPSVILDLDVASNKLRAGSQVLPEETLDAVVKGITATISAKADSES